MVTQSRFLWRIETNSWVYWENIDLKGEIDKMQEEKPKITEYIYSIIIFNKLLSLTPTSREFGNILEQTIGFYDSIQLIFVDTVSYDQLADEWKNFMNSGTILVKKKAKGLSLERLLKQ